MTGWAIFMLAELSKIGLSSGFGHCLEVLAVFLSAPSAPIMNLGSSLLLLSFVLAGCASQIDSSKRD